MKDERVEGFLGVIAGLFGFLFFLWLTIISQDPEYVAIGTLFLIAMAAGIYVLRNGKAITVERSSNA